MRGSAETSSGGAAGESSSDLLRRVDEDRWLASRFAKAPIRARLERLYAFNYEVARVASLVSEPMIGALRLAWWRDATLGEGDPHGARSHPLAMAMAEEAQANGVFGQRLRGLIEARTKDLEEVPFNTWADLEAYLDNTAGGVFALAVEICLPQATQPRQTNEAIRAAGRAWGITGLMRALPVWSARRRTFFPRGLLDHVGLTSEALFAGQDVFAMHAAGRALLDRAGHAHEIASELARMMPSAAFPALGYLALEPGYRRALAANPLAPTPGPGPLARRARLVRACLTGAL